MKTFYAAAQVFYERGAKLRVIPKALLIRASDEDAASMVAADYVTDTFPAPAYFDHEHEVHELEGVSLEDDLLILDVADEFILATPT